MTSKIKFSFDLLCVLYILSVVIHIFSHRKIFLIDSTYFTKNRMIAIKWLSGKRKNKLISETWMYNILDRGAISEV